MRADSSTVLADFVRFGTTSSVAGSLHCCSRRELNFKSIHSSKLPFLPSSLPLPLFLPA